VHGNRGEDPTEPAANSHYPWPTVTHELRIQRLSDDFARSGLKPFHVPVGTVRFGQDPKTSVLDVNCKAHEVDNLYLVGGSFFPSSAAVNPALPIMANALRVGAHLMKRLGVSETTYEQHLHDGELAGTR
jgi:choline dehydrogenase-like flavoprotein